MCKNAKIHLLVSTLFTFAMGLSNIFVNVFFWRQTNNFRIVVIYNMIQYIVIPLTFITAGNIAKRKNGILPMRLGLLFYAMFFIIILTIGGKGMLYIYLLGIVHGIAAGFYWLAFNTLCFDYTDTGNRDTFNGFNGSCAGVAAAGAPITAGYIISRFTGTAGYRIVFAVALGIFVILIFISLRLKCKNFAGRVDFKKAFGRNNEEWGTVKKATTLWGMRDMVIVFVVNILIMETTGSELSLGQLTLIASLLSSISYAAVQRFIKPPKRRLAIFIGTAGAFLAVSGLAFRVEYATLLFYIILDALALPFFLVQLGSSTFNVISRAHEENLRIEYMINKDIALNSGRIISAAVLLLVTSITDSTSMLQGYLLFIGAAPLASGLLLGKLKKVLSGACQ